MRLHNTKKPSTLSESAPGIEKLLRSSGTAFWDKSPESKALAKQIDRTGKSQEKIAREFFEGGSNRCLGANVEIAGVEIDLVFREPFGDIYLVEVKSLTSTEFLERRVKPEQRKRIRRAMTALIERGYIVRAHLAVVKRGEIYILWDYFV